MKKINSIILFLKTCIGINKDFYKPHPIITSIENVEFDAAQASDLIEELVDYKYQLNKVPSLNERIGLNNFFTKLKTFLAKQLLHHQRCRLKPLIYFSSEASNSTSNFIRLTNSFHWMCACILLKNSWSFPLGLHESVRISPGAMLLALIL